MMHFKLFCFLGIQSLFICNAFSQLNSFHKKIFLPYSATVTDVTECNNGDVAFTGYMQLPAGRCMIFGRNDFFGDNIILEKYINAYTWATGLCEGWKILELDNGNFIITGLAWGPDIAQPTSMLVPKLVEKGINMWGIPLWEWSSSAQFGYYSNAGILQVGPNKYQTVNGFSFGGSSTKFNTMDSNGVVSSSVRLDYMSIYSTYSCALDMDKSRIFLRDGGGVWDSIRVHKADSSDQISWSRNLPVFASPKELIVKGRSIILLFSDNTSTYVIKMNSNGDFVTGLKLDSQLSLQASSIVNAAGSTFFLTGNTVDSDKFFIIKMDTSFNIIYSKKYFQNNVPLNLSAGGLNVMQDGTLLAWGNGNGFVFSRMDSSGISLCIQDSDFICISQPYTINVIPDPLSFSVVILPGPLIPGQAILSQGFGSSTSTSGCQILTDETVDPSIPGSCMLFPNPTNDHLYIDWKHGQGSEVLFSIYSIGGETILRGNLNNSNSIDCSELPSGIYCIRLISEGSIAVKKFIIKK